jgi:hypothetical protein
MHNLLPHNKGRTQIKSVWEQGTEENILDPREMKW